MKEWSKAKPPQGFYAVLIGGVIISVWFGFFIQTGEVRQARHQFELDTERKINILEDGLRMIPALLESVASFFHASQFVDPDEFKTFTTPLLKKHRYFSIEYLPLVTHEQRPVFGLKDRPLEIRELNSENVLVPRSEQPVYYPVLYVEPFDKNQVALGFDHRSDPDRMYAMEQAQRRGEPFSTSPRKLFRVGRGGEDQDSVVVFYPVMKQDAGPNEPQKEGFMSLVVEMGPMIRDISQPLRSSGIVYELYQMGPDGSKPILVFSDQIREGNIFASHEETFRLMGHTWKVRALKLTPLVRGFSAGSILVMVVGFCFFGMVAVYIQGLHTRRRFIQEEVIERTQTIAEREKQLNQELREKDVVQQELDRRKNAVLQLNQIAEMLHTSRSFRDVFDILKEGAEKLFPKIKGEVYVLTETDNAMELGVSWGQPHQQGVTYPLESCWALRRGRAHRFVKGESLGRCEHAHLAGDDTQILCKQIMGQGETIGVLSLYSKEEISDFQEEILDQFCGQLGLVLANVKLYMELRDKSVRDSLTGLFNRRFLEEVLRKEVHRAKRSQSKFAVIMMDIDHFKRFNDENGHETGDALLEALGGLAQRWFRNYDVACRYGGEEFTVVLVDIQAEEALKRMNLFREEVRKLQIQHRGGMLKGITVSLGIAMFPENASTAEDLIHAADSALYNAKAAGRNRAVMASSTGSFIPAPSKEKT